MYYACSTNMCVCLCVSVYIIANIDVFTYFNKSLQLRVFLILSIVSISNNHGESSTVRWHVILRIGRFLIRIPLMPLDGLWNPTLLRSSLWPLGQTRNNFVIIFRWVRVSLCQWPKVGPLIQITDKK